MAESGTRLKVKAMYPGPKWAGRVNRMTDLQVHAIWVKEQQKQADRAREARAQAEQQQTLDF